MTDLEELRKQTERGDRLDQLQDAGPETDAEDDVEAGRNGTVETPVEPTESAAAEPLDADVEASTEPTDATPIEVDDPEPAVETEVEAEVETKVETEVETETEVTSGEPTLADAIEPEVEDETVDSEPVEDEGATTDDEEPAAESESVAAKDEPDEQVEQLQVVEFKLGDDLCALDIHEVESLVEMTNVTRVPRTSDAIDGVIDLRGETTAIVDLKSFLGTTGEGGGEYIIVLDRPDDKQKVGITVDEVTEVVTYDRDLVDDSTALVDLNTRGMQHSVSRGVIRKLRDDDLDLVVWLDIDAVIEGIQEGDGVILDALGDEQVTDDGVA